MMMGNTTYDKFYTPSGDLVPGDVWDGGEPNNAGRQQTQYFNQSDETVVYYMDGKLLDITEDCRLPDGTFANCSVACQYSAPTGI
jgi:hypothetical protein